MVPSIESSSRAVACGLPPLVHMPMSPAPAKISGGSPAAGAASGTADVPARLPAEMVLGAVRPCGEPPHDRQNTASAAVAGDTNRVSSFRRWTDDISLPLSSLV